MVPLYVAQSYIEIYSTIYCACPSFHDFAALHISRIKSIEKMSTDGIYAYRTHWLPTKLPVFLYTERLESDEEAY